MESYPTKRTIIWSPLEIIELEQLHVQLPSEEMAASEAVAAAYEWRQRAKAAVETAEQQYDGTNRQSQNEYHRAHRLADGLTLYANMVVDAYPQEYMSYLQQLEARQ